MGLEPINVELTDFNKLELLRDEEESLGEKLAEVEKSIRDAMLAAARREFLMSLSPYYASVAAGEVDRLGKAVAAAANAALTRARKHAGTEMSKLTSGLGLNGLLGPGQ